MPVTITNNIHVLNKALAKAMSLGLDQAGQYLEGKIVENIRSNMPPPNAPLTIALKGSSSTLIDTGEMMNAVTSEKKSGTEIWVGVFGSENAKKALINEFGAPAAAIPSRPFIRNAINDQSDKTAMNEKVVKEIRGAIASSVIK